METIANHPIKHGSALNDGQKEWKKKHASKNVWNECGAQSR